MISVKELREIARDGAASLEIDWLKALHDAADEITRLRIAMQRAADMLPANVACGVLRAALAKKE